MDKTHSVLNNCKNDRKSFDSAMSAGDFALAKEEAFNLEACALGMGDEELAAKAKELGALATGKIAAKSTGENSHKHAAASGAFLANFSETLLNVYGDMANLPAEVKQALAKLSAARGSSAFSAEAAKIINELRLSPETYPAFEIGTALLANHGGELLAAAKALEASAASGFIGDKTASFAYDFIFGNPENTLLPLYAAGKLGKLVEGLTALGAEALGVTRAATTALKTTTGLATEAPVFVGTGKVVAYEKGKPVELDAGTFFKESFSSGLVFGGLKAAGFFAQTFNLFLPSTEAGRALSLWNANFASVGALMAVSGAERLAAGEHAEARSNLDAFVEALVVHLGLTKMMGSVHGARSGVEYARLVSVSLEAFARLKNIFYPELAAAGVGRFNGLAEISDVMQQGSPTNSPSSDVCANVERRLFAAALREIAGLIDSGVITAADADAIVSASFGRRLGVIGPFATADVGENGITFSKISAYLFKELFNNTSGGDFIERLKVGAASVYAAGGAAQNPFDATPSELSVFKKVAVVGSGTMSVGIMLEFALGGMDVVVWGHSPSRLNAALHKFYNALDLHLSNGLITKGEYNLAKKRVSTTLDLSDAVAEADLVVETVVEDLEVKRQLFAQFERLSNKKEAIFATNSSGLKLSEIVSEMCDASRGVVLHFWNPAHLLPLVEVVGTTPDSTSARLAGSLMQRLGKKPILLKKEVVGNVGNRIQFALFREANAIVEAGLATLSEVDQIVTSGFGKYLAQNGFIGTALMYGKDFIQESAELFLDLSNSTEPPALLLENVKAKRTGMDAGAGYYVWADWAKKMVLSLRDSALYEFRKNDLRRLRLDEIPKFDASNDLFLEGRTHFSVTELFRKLVRFQVNWQDSGLSIVGKDGVERNVLWAQVLGKSYFFVMHSSSMAVDVIARVDVWKGFNDSLVENNRIDERRLIKVPYETLTPADVEKNGGVIVETELSRADCIGWLNDVLKLQIDTQGLDPKTPTFHMLMNLLMDKATHVNKRDVNVGDIVIYGTMQVREYGDTKESFVPRHVGIVARIENGNVFVRSKWGLGNVYETPLDVNLEEWGANVVFMRLKKNSGAEPVVKDGVAPIEEPTFYELLEEYLDPMIEWDHINGIKHDHHDYYYKKHSERRRKPARSAVTPPTRLSDLDPESGTYFKHDPNYAGAKALKTETVLNFRPTRSSKLAIHINLGGRDYTARLKIELTDDGFKFDPEPIYKIGQTISWIQPVIKTNSGFLLNGNRVLFGDSISISYEDGGEQVSFHFDIPFMRNCESTIEDAVKVVETVDSNNHLTNSFSVFFVKSAEFFFRLMQGYDVKYPVAFYKYIPDDVADVSPTLMTVVGGNLDHKAHSIMRLASCAAAGDSGLEPVDMVTTTDRLMTPSAADRPFIYNYYDTTYLRVIERFLAETFGIDVRSVMIERDATTKPRPINNE